MSYFLLGLQYCASAAMIVLIAMGGMFLVMWGVRLIYGQQTQVDGLGAPEGDARHFYLKSEDDGRGGL